MDNINTEQSQKLDDWINEVNQDLSPETLRIATKAIASAKVNTESIPFAVIDPRIRYTP